MCRKTHSKYCGVRLSVISFWDHNFQVNAGTSISISSQVTCDDIADPHQFYVLSRISDVFVLQCTPMSPVFAFFFRCHNFLIDDILLWKSAVCRMSEGNEFLSKERLTFSFGDMFSAKIKFWYESRRLECFIKTCLIFEAYDGKK